MIRQGLTVLAALALASAAGCGRSQPREEVVRDSGASAPAPDTTKTEKPPAVTKAPPPPPPPPPSPRSIDAVLAAHNDSLLAVPGVLGTAAGRCNSAPCIRVLVARVTDEIRRRVPRTLEGYPVHIDVTGTVVPRQ